MVRQGMIELIVTLRDWTAADTSEYDSNKLQAILDGRRRDIYREPLRLLGDPEPGVVMYRDYRFTALYMERAESGTAAWRVEDSTGALVGTALYEVNYEARTITFANNTAGTAYYLTGRAYDLHRAAAEVWRTKAASVAARFDVKTDNHDLKRSQLVTHYEKMAKQYEMQAPARSVRRVSGDADF